MCIQDFTYTEGLHQNISSVLGCVDNTRRKRRADYVIYNLHSFQIFMKNNEREFYMMI